MVFKINGDNTNDKSASTPITPLNNTQTNPYGIFYDPMKSASKKITGEDTNDIPTPARVKPSGSTPAYPCGIFYDPLKSANKNTKSDNSGNTNTPATMPSQNNNSDNAYDIFCDSPKSANKQTATDVSNPAPVTPLIDTPKSYGAFYDWEQYRKNQFTLKDTDYTSDPGSRREFWINDKRDSKFITYFNNKAIKISSYKNDKHSETSLIKDDLVNFVNNNLNKDNISNFLDMYGWGEFIIDIFNNDSIDWDAKNSVYNTIMNLIDLRDPDHMYNYHNILENKKKELIMDGDFEGNFYQQGTGDCIIIGRLLAILSRPKGKALLQSLVRIDDSGNMVINFSGWNKEVKVTYSDLYNKENFCLSRENADIKALEIAWKKIRKNIGGLNNPFSNHDFDRALLGGCIPINEIRSTEYLCPYPTLAKRSLKKYWKEEFNNPDKAYALGCTILNFISGIGVNITREDCDDCKMKIQPGHQFAITKADDNYVYIQDPHFGPENYKLKWKDFNRLSFLLHEMNLDPIGTNVSKEEIRETLSDQCFML